MRTTTPGGAPAPSTVRAALRYLVERTAPGTPTPLLVSVDEAHGADPATLGSLLNAVQALGGRAVGLPVAAALAGTPDILDRLRHADCGATWFLDRGQEERLAPMPNDLSAADCHRAIEAPLAAAGVGIANARALDAAVADCRGSPYFLQVLGRAALAAAADNNDVADFRAGEPIRQAFGRAVAGRHSAVWEDLAGRGLAGCARQLGALWRATGGTGEGISSALVADAVRSGAALGPPATALNAGPVDVGRALAAMRHLGLLWSPNGAPDGPWDLGLPSFFDYAEAQLAASRSPAHRASLAAMEADLERILGDGADGPTQGADAFTADAPPTLPRAPKPPTPP